MDQRRVIARNVLWNWAGMGVTIGCGLVVMPFLIRHLGETRYGLWILIGSLTGYFSLLDLGVRGSIGRYVAYYRAKNDPDGVGATVSTAVAILCVPAALALLGTVGAVALFFHLFDVPPDQVESVRLAMLIVGVNLALTFPAGALEGTLWGYQRFDLWNAIDIPVNLARTGLTFNFIGNGHGLVALALLVLSSTAAAAAAKAVVVFRLDRSLRVGPRLVRWAFARNLFSYGLWSFLLAVTALVTGQIGLLIVGNRLGVALVTLYSVVLRLINTARDFVLTTTGVLTPVATALHAEEKHRQQRRLFVEGGRYCLALALLFLALFVWLGEPLLTLWLGRSLNPGQLRVTYELLVISAFGQVVPLSQWVSYGIILGMNRHRLLALVSLAELVGATALAFVLVGPYGLYGVCVAFVVGEFLGRGLVKVVYGCRLVRVPLGRYVTQALLIPAAAAAAPVLGLALLQRWWVPGTWAQLVLVSALFTVVYTATCALFLLGRNRVWALAAGAYRKLSGPGKPAEPETSGPHAREARPADAPG